MTEKNENTCMFLVRSHETLYQLELIFVFVVYCYILFFQDSYPGCISLPIFKQNQDKIMLRFLFVRSLVPYLYSTKKRNAEIFVVLLHSAKLIVT
jgi:hypothetical protein